MEKIEELIQEKENTESRTLLHAHHQNPKQARSETVFSESSQK